MQTVKRYDPRPEPITHYRGSVTIVTTLGPGHEQNEYIECEHLHRTEKAANRCVAQLVKGR